MFKNQKSQLLFLFILSVALLTACAAPTETPAPTENPDAGIPEEVLAARDAVLDFMREGSTICDPPELVTWKAALAEQCGHGDEGGGSWGNHGFPHVKLQMEGSVG